MRNKKIPSNRQHHEALILVEGETEIEFYTAFADRFFKDKKKTMRNLKGNFNINTKIADRILQFHQQHPEYAFDVYVCIDQEMKDKKPSINPKTLREILAEKSSTIDSKFICFIPVVAILMLESLFFIDIEGLYQYLKAPKQKRNPKKYSNFRLRTHKDLSILFESFGKFYRKGHRCEGLIASLDLHKIAAKAEELNNFRAKMQGY